MTDHFQTIALVAVIALFLISYVGAKWAIKTQYVIMTILGLSILVFLGGAAFHFNRAVFIENFSSQYSGPSITFWTVFAIYFPAVTGIMAGVNMSGDLENPGRSIPMGTMAAVGAGFIIYALQILLCGGAQTRFQLLGSSFETLGEQALFGTGFLVVAGVFAATLSSAIGSLLGAPRVLQAVARDDVLYPLRPFARGSSKGDEPHRALILTLAISIGIILWAGNNPGGGAFNVLAAIVTMFFLYTYGMVNLAAFVESFAGNPSFRPRFKYYHWGPALCGTVACATTAFLIDPVAAVLAAVLLIILYSFLRKKVLQVRFGDARWGFTYSRVRNNLLKLSKMSEDPKNWRPTVLVLLRDPEDHLTMAMYALWVGEDRGLVTLARVLVGDLSEISNLKDTAVTQLERFLEENDFDALPTVVVSRSLDEGLISLIQGNAIGPLRPNIVLMGWSYDEQRFGSFVHLLNSVILLKKSIILINDKGLPTTGRSRRIDIWWRGRENGSLMVIIAHLLSLNWEWSEANIRILRLIGDEDGREPASKALRDLVDAARVDAEVMVLVSESSFQEVLWRHSGDASVVLMGFNVPEEEDIELFRNRFEEMLSNLPTTLLVCSSGEADLLA
jgi:hypothetical protein